MKNTYKQPKTLVYKISMVQFLAASDTLQRGTGSGGNRAETKAMFDDFEDEE